MHPRYRKFHVVAVLAWAATIACLLWLPSHWLLTPPGARYHTAGLVSTMVVMAGVLLVGWIGFRWLCAFFQDEH